MPERCPMCGREVTNWLRPNAHPPVTDEMVERAARAIHEVSDDVLPFDLPAPKGVGRREERTRQKGIDERRERYLVTARAALEAALGGTG